MAQDADRIRSVPDEAFAVMTLSEFLIVMKL
jgi:hypothetical protein